MVPFGRRDGGGQLTVHTRVFGMSEPYGERDAFGLGEHVLGLHLHRGDGEGGHDLQPDLAIEARIGEIVDLAAEGRDFGVLLARKQDGDQVLAFGEVVRQGRFEGGVAVLLGRDQGAVHEDPCIRHDAVEDEAYLLRFEIRAEGEASLVKIAPLVGLLVEIVEGQVGGVVGEMHTLPGMGDRWIGIRMGAAKRPVRRKGLKIPDHVLCSPSSAEVSAIPMTQRSGRPVARLEISHSENGVLPECKETGSGSGPDRGLVQPAAFTIPAKSAALSEAPPTRPPSTFSSPKISAALPGLTEPP